jgi:hypothetical protein
MDNHKVATSKEQKLIDLECPTDGEEPLEIEIEIVFKKLMKSI